MNNQTQLKAYANEELIVINEEIKKHEQYLKEETDEQLIMVLDLALERLEQKQAIYQHFIKTSA